MEIVVDAWLAELAALIKLAGTERGCMGLGIQLRAPPPHWFVPNPMPLRQPPPLPCCGLLLWQRRRVAEVARAVVLMTEGEGVERGTWRIHQ